MIILFTSREYYRRLIEFVLVELLKHDIHVTETLFPTRTIEKNLSASILFAIYAVVIVEVAKHVLSCLVAVWTW